MDLFLDQFLNLFAGKNDTTHTGESIFGSIYEYLRKDSVQHDIKHMGESISGSIFGCLCKDSVQYDTKHMEESIYGSISSGYLPMNSVQHDTKYTRNQRVDKFLDIYPCIIKALAIVRTFVHLLMIESVVFVYKNL